jgi:hypothetical protein
LPRPLFSYNRLIRTVPQEDIKFLINSLDNLLG